MNGESLGGGIVGALVLAAAGWLGKALVTYTRGRAERRKLTTEQGLTGLQAREQRSWSLMEGRIEDLEGALDRLANSERRLQDDVARLRDERDKARDAATDERLRAKELDQKLAACRRLHENLRHELERQQAVIERLQGE